MAKWECRVCMYIHEGDSPPESCPVCGALAGEFSPQEEDETAESSDS